MDNRIQSAHSRDFLEIKPPYRLPSENGAITKKELDSVVKQANDNLRDIYTKLYGRIALKDLNGTTQDVISNKLDSDGVSSWVTQNADHIALSVSSVPSYQKDKVFRGDIPPANPVEDMLWVDTSITPSMLKRYDGTAWTVLGTDKVKTSGISITSNNVEIATPNFDLKILDDNGDPVLSMSADDAGFDNLYVNKLVSPSVPKLLPIEGKAYSVGPNSSYRTVTDCLMNIPEICMGPITIYVEDADITDNIIIKGRNFTWLTINLGGKTLYGTIMLEGINGVVQITNGTIIDNTPDYNADNAVITARSCQLTRLEGLNINANYKKLAGISVTYGMADIRTCDIYKVSTQRWTAACMNFTLSMATIFNCKGTGPYGIYASFGGTLRLIGTVPKGNTANQYISQVQVLNDTDPTATQSDYESSTQPTIPITATFTATNGGSYRTDGYTESEVYQGAYTSGKYKFGLWFFNYGAIQTALSGKTITAVKFTCTRYATANGSASPQQPTFYYHNYASMPTSYPSASGAGTKGVAYDRGDRKTISLPTSFGDALKNGTAKGIAVYAGYQTASPYMKFEPKSAVLEITYQ